jgi:hypothetical protein
MMKKNHMEKMKQFEIRLAMMETLVDNMAQNQVILSAPDSVFKWDENADEYQLQ